MNVLTETRLGKFLSKLNFDSSNALQNEAFDALRNMDFPTTRDEYWKYTRLNKIANADLTVSSGILDFARLSEDIKSYIVSDQYIVIENGIYREDLSQFDNNKYDVQISQDLESTSANFADIFQTINTAFVKETIHIDIPKNTIWEKPVQIIYINSGEGIMTNTSLVITADTSTKANIITTFIEGQSGNLSNHYTEVSVSDNANITLDKIQIGNGWYIATENVTQQANSTFKINTVTLSGDIVRNNLNIEVEGENCETYLNGAVITKGQQLVDNHSFVNHLVSNCMSDENYKYVLDDKSTGVFNGRVVVQQDAQKINAYQQNGNILLSDFAKINSKPELEIYADDVKCSHGSTTGQLDEDALFYLQTRGLSKDKARKLLVSAFTGEVFNAIDDENLSALILKVLEEKFDWTTD